MGFHEGDKVPDTPLLLARLVLTLYAEDLCHSSVLLLEDSAEGVSVREEEEVEVVVCEVRLEVAEEAAAAPYQLLLTALEACNVARYEDELCVRR